MDGKRGYAVLAVPKSGLFLKNGELETGNGSAMRFDEILIFSRRVDAESHARTNQTYWAQNPKRNDDWDFAVLPVFVRDRT